MTSDPSILLAWMRGRGTGDVTARAISDAGPRPFRRRSESDAALAVLIESGAIVEVSARPRSFRVAAEVSGQVAQETPGRRGEGVSFQVETILPDQPDGGAFEDRQDDEILSQRAKVLPDRGTPGQPGGSSRQGINSQVEKEFGGRGSADDLQNCGPIPVAEVRSLLAERTAHHAAGGLADDAMRYMAARDTFEALKADPRLALAQITPGRCNVCGYPSRETFLRVGAGGVLVHPACLGEHRRMVAERIDELVVNALG